MQVLFVMMPVIAGVLEISQSIGEFYEFHPAMLCMFYYVIDLA
jgi:hypothetical protein